MRHHPDHIQITLDIAATYLAEAAACEDDAMHTGRQMTALEVLGSAVLRVVERQSSSDCQVITGWPHRY